MWNIGRKGESAGRRRFLRTAIATAGMAIVGRAAAGIAAPSGEGAGIDSGAASTTKESVGYRETDHIRRYYETTRL